MTIRNRILALSLALCLCAGLLPMSSLAAQAAIDPDARYVVVYTGDEASLMDSTAEPDYEILDGAALRGAVASGRVAWYEEDPVAVLLGDTEKWDHEMIGFAQAEETYALGQGITVAFIDSGASPHADYNANLLTGCNVLDGSADTNDTLNHGSCVAGILAAAMDGSGINGTAPKAKLLPIKAFDSSVTSYGSDLAKGIRTAIDTYGVKLINMSCGLSQGSTLLKSAVEYAESKGVIIVAAAGNYGSYSPFYPAAYDGVIGVGSVGRTGTVSSFSERNGVWVAAPGENIYGTNNTGGYSTRSGTSFATPAVSGIVADLLTVNGSLSPEDVRGILRDTAVDAGDEGYDVFYGYGIVSLSAALDSVLEGTDYFLSPLDATDDGTDISVYNNTDETVSGSLVQACWNGSSRTELLSAAGLSVTLAPGEGAVLAADDTEGYLRDVFLAQDGTPLTEVRRTALSTVRAADTLFSFVLPVDAMSGSGVLLYNGNGETVFGEIAPADGTYAIPMRESLYNSWRAENTCTFVAVVDGMEEEMDLHEYAAVPLPAEGVIRHTCAACGSSYDVLQTPAEVTGITAAPAAAGGITISWDTADYATAYRVYRRDSAGGSWKILTSTAQGNSWTDLTGTPGVSYRYTVRGVNGELISPKYSVSADVTMPYFPAVITAQPESAAAFVGSDAVFTVTATGSGLSYQWQYKSPTGTKWANSSLAGNKTASFTVPATLGRDGYSYRCRITGTAGNTVYSEPACLTVKLPVTITAQPQNTAAGIGTSAVFTVTAAGEGLSYQWQYRSPTGTKWANSTLAGNKTDTFSVTATAARDGYSYRCKITAGGYTVYSDAAVLTVVPITITSQPQSANAIAGSTAVFTVAAAGEGLSYQWQYRSPDGTKWANSSLSGNKTDTFSVKATAARDGYSYRCKITDAAGGTVYSEPAVLTVYVITITAQPESVSAAVGSTAVFTVAADIEGSTEGLSYQWQYKSPTGTKWANSSLSGNRTDTFSVSATAGRDGYAYRCKITDSLGGTIYSEPAVLTVL